MKILVMGLPGSGKTTFAKKLSKRLAAVHFNADEVRGTINKHLGFSETDRLQQAFTMGWMCDQVCRAGVVAVADFVCPTPMTRQMFGKDAVVVFMDTITAGRFADTNRVFVPARSPNFIVTDWSQSPDIIDRIAKL